MMPHIFKILVIVGALFTAAGCAEIVVKQVHYREAPLVSDTDNPTPIKFSRLRFLLPPGTEIGLESGMGPSWLGGFCTMTANPISRREVMAGRLVETQYVKQTFSDALEANGYDVVENITIDFRPEDEVDRAEYFVSARVSDMDLDLCKRGRVRTFNLFDTAPGAKGKMYIKVDWSIYDALRRTVVYKTTTEGYTRRDYPNVEGMQIMFYDAFDMASHNLAADGAFYDLIVKGKKPPKGWRDAPHSEVMKQRPRLYDSREAVDLPPQALSRQPLEKHVESALESAVMIQKNGHGSGFFISKNGHILTNHHVVGDAQRMRIVTHDKKHRLIAEVLRVDRVRDVALLKLEDMPSNLKIKPLPIRTRKLTVSEDVYAVGVPRDWRFYQSSVTKGIVSAHRIYKDEGVRLPFIQADVEIHGGNSGGALLDERGNVVGVAVSGATIPGISSKLGVGLNSFIPIADALHALEITVGGRPVPLTTNNRERVSQNESSLAPHAP